MPQLGGMPTLLAASIDTSGVSVSTNRPLFIVATVLATVALAGILFALIAAVMQQRDPTSIAVALCPVLGGAITALILQGRDSKKRGEDGPE